ncbi:MAG: hypothetical protein JJT77_11285 [Crocinitomicaceae bacterium]|nr:hypothetical protein [Crocinitomicaceae bacterium]
MDSYAYNKEMKIPFYIFRNCKTCPSDVERGALWFSSYDCCNVELFDSISKLFKNTFENHDLNIFKHERINKFQINENNKQWRVKHRETVDTSFIKNNIDSGLNLIPIITYKDYFGSNPGGYEASANIHFTILLYDKYSLIYSATVQKNASHPFMIEKSEFDVSNINVDKVISELVEDALKPYKERLK